MEMKSRHTILIYLLSVIQLGLCETAASVNFTDIRIQSTNALGALWSGGCAQGDVAVQISPQVLTRTFMTSTTLDTVYQAANQQIVSFINSTFFTIPNTSDLLILSAPIELTCKGVVLKDYVVLLVQSPTSWSANVHVSAISSNYNLEVFGAFHKQCSSTDTYGFNCDTICVPMDDGVYCYTCSTAGSKICCPNVDQVYCNYNNVTINIATTTVNPNSSDSSTSSTNPTICSNHSNQNLYFWLLIGMSVLALILLILVILFVFMLCSRRKERPPIYVDRTRVTPVYTTDVERERYEDHSHPYRRSSSIPRARTSYRESREYANHDHWKDDRMGTDRRKRTRTRSSSRRRVTPTEPRDIII